MTEDELRIAAVEKAVLALAPFVDAKVVAAALATLADEMETAEGDERTAVLGAIELIEDGRRRFAGPELGVWLRRGG